MAMQIGTIKKIANFKGLMGDKELRYEEINDIINAHSKDVPSWATLRKYNVIDVVRVEGYSVELPDEGEAKLWNGWYEWNAAKQVWIIDHFFKIYKLV